MERAVAATLISEIQAGREAISPTEDSRESTAAWINLAGTWQRGPTPGPQIHAGVAS
jgi:hypothetical protein